MQVKMTKIHGPLGEASHYTLHTKDMVDVDWKGNPLEATHDGYEKAVFCSHGGAAAFCKMRGLDLISTFQDELTLYEGSVLFDSVEEFQAFCKKYGLRAKVVE